MLTPEQTEGPYYIPNERVRRNITEGRPGAPLVLRLSVVAQLYFPDSLTDRVFGRKPYSRRPTRDTRNATDAVFRNGGRRSLLSLRRSAGIYVGTITMGVHRT